MEQHEISQQQVRDLAQKIYSACGTSLVAHERAFLDRLFNVLDKALDPVEEEESRADPEAQRGDYTGTLILAGPGDDVRQLRRQFDTAFDRDLHLRSGWIDAIIRAIVSVGKIGHHPTVERPPEPGPDPGPDDRRSSPDPAREL